LGFTRRNCESILVFRSRAFNVSSRIAISLVVILVCFAAASAVSAAQASVAPSAMRSRLDPKPALPSVLATFSLYEVVGIDAAHGDKDIDDFILALIRNPSFPYRVNDIAVECGNSLYQPVLDRYIAGEQVPFAEVKKVWRNTTQPMCGQSAFFEQLFPLIRAINQALPAEHRLRVLATDPPVDWALIHDQKDFSPFTDRDGSIASVMEKEVLSKRRKALMLFGIFHLLHGSGPGNGDAVTIYEKKYPGSTFVISDLGYFGKDPKDAIKVSFANWPNPSLIRTRGTSLGSLKLDAFLPTPISTDDQCNVIDPFKGRPTLMVADMIDAFLYLGPQNLRLKEALPADIALDTSYMSELLRRNAIIGLPGPQSLSDFNKQTVASAASPLLTVERLPDAREFYPMIRQLCLERTKKNNAKPPN
jgi:hypothetical protein